MVAFFYCCFLFNALIESSSRLKKYSSNRLAEKDDVLGLVSRLIKETPIVD